MEPPSQPRRGTKELTEKQKGSHNNSAERVQRLERENRMLSSSLESSEERAEQLALQVLTVQKVTKEIRVIKGIRDFHLAWI